MVFMCDSMICYLATWELYFLVDLICTALDMLWLSK